MPGSYGMETISGPATVTWNSVALGVMHGEEGVPTVMTRAMVRMIENTDKYGDAPLGGVYRGVRGRAMMRAQESLKTGVVAACWPWGVDGVMGQVGRDIYDLAQPLVLTAVAGTPLAAKLASITCGKAIIAPDFDIRRAYGPILQECALEFLLLLYAASGPVDALYTKA